MALKWLEKGNEDEYRVNSEMPYFFFFFKKRVLSSLLFFFLFFFLFSFLLLFLEPYHKSFFFIRVAHKLFLKPSRLFSRLETSSYHRGQQNTVKPHGTKVSKCSWNSPTKGYRSVGTLMTISESNGISWFLSPIKYKSKLVSWSMNRSAPICMQAIHSFNNKIWAQE